MLYFPAAGSLPVTVSGSASALKRLRVHISASPRWLSVKFWILHCFKDALLQTTRSKLSEVWGAEIRCFACSNEWWVTVCELCGRNCLHVRLCVCAFVCPDGNLATLEWNLEYAQYVGRLILCSSAHLFHPRLRCLPAPPPSGPSRVVSPLLCCSCCCKWSGLMASPQSRVLILCRWRCGEIKQVYVVLSVKSWWLSSCFLHCFWSSYSSGAITANRPPLHMSFHYSYFFPQARKREAWSESPDISLGSSPLASNSEAKHIWLPRSRFHPFPPAPKVELKSQATFPPLFLINCFRSSPSK